MFCKSAADLREQFGTEFFYEMAGLYSLSANAEAQIQNTYGTENDFVISHSVGEDPLFVTNGNMVSVFWRGDVPYLREKKSARMRRAPALHFHGKGKYVMECHLRLANRSIQLQNSRNRTLSAAVKYPLRWARRCGGGRWWPGI